MSPTQPKRGLDYYNEIDPYVAQTIRNLIEAGTLPPGEVDERSIEDVRPSDLRGYTQCHFFAGVGVWSYALRRAGWPADRPVWTASCPCQPFSSAGQGNGFDDPRHLWPALAWLIGECRPPVIFGEQVASKAVNAWIDLVQANMEALDYAFGCVPFPAAGVGSPNIRDRAYWMANASGQRLQECQRLAGVPGGASGSGPGQASERGGIRATGGVAHADSDRQSPGRLSVRPGGQDEAATVSEWPGETGRVADPDLQCEVPAGNPARIGDPERSKPTRRLADASDIRCQRRRAGLESDGGDSARLESERLRHADRPGPTNGIWRSADWLLCRDDKWRPVEPGTFPLVDGTAARVGRGGAHWTTPAGKEGFGHRAGRLKAYGNAINAEAARVFIASYLDDNQDKCP